MDKFPKIRYPSDPQADGLLDSDVVVTEKLDGANFRFTWDENGTLHVGTRNITYDNALDNENLPGAFKHAVKYISETVQHRVGYEDYTLYGESMHLHSLDYNNINWETPNKGSPHVPLDSEIPNVVVFDVKRKNKWLRWDDVVSVAKQMGLSVIRTIERGDPECLSFEIPDESTFGGPPEGIVVRRVDGSVRAKKVSDDFKEQNAISFESPSKAQSDAGAFVSSYVTDARIQKVAHKLVDEGQYEQPRMEMMEDLPREVLRDAMAENGWELLTSGGFECEWDDDFKGEVRSKSSKKCARTLKTMLQSL